MAWHDGLDTDAITAATAKGWHQLPDADAAKAIFGSYRGLEKVHGQASSGEYIKLADFGAADPAVAAAAWEKLGRPKDAAGYALDAIKDSKGQSLDAGLIETARKAAHEANMPPAMLAKFFQGLLPWMETDETADANALQVRRQASEAALNAEWGANAINNKYVANRAMDAFKAMTGVDWQPALNKLEAAEDGPGYAGIWKMFHALGNAMGEGRFIPAGGLDSNKAITPQQAADQWKSLLADEGWRSRAMAGDVNALKQKTDLMAIIANDPSVMLR